MPSKGGLLGLNNNPFNSLTANALMNCLNFLVRSQIQKTCALVSTYNVLYFYRKNMDFQPNKIFF